MSYRLPPLNGLRAFEAAARHLSFTRAADELGVTPGAVSQQVKSLEGALGVTLFRRLPRSLILTDEGEAYLPAISSASTSFPGRRKRLRRRCAAGSSALELRRAS